MKAIYRPKNKNIFAYLDRCKGYEYEFEFLSIVGGAMMFKPVDKNFASSSQVPESDLDFIDGFGEGVYRMIASGWDINSRPITEKDISTHEFNMMGNRIFKKLKEVDYEKNMDR